MGAADVAFVVSVIADVVLYLRLCCAARLYQRLAGTGFCHGWVEDKCAAVFCRCG